jgi:uncharacterized protein
MVEACTTKEVKTDSRRVEIELFCRALVARYRPVRITLFGSHASGAARQDSDVDLLVELASVGTGLGTAAGMVREMKPRFSVDLLVRTPRQVKKRLRMGDPFMAEVVSTGKVLYEASDR